MVQQKEIGMGGHSSKRSTETSLVQTNMTNPTAFVFGCPTKHKKPQEQEGTGTLLLAMKTARLLINGQAFPRITLAG